MLTRFKKSDFRNTHVDVLVTNQAMTFLQTDDRFLGVRDVPLLLVESPSGILSVLDTDDLNRDEVDLRGRQSEAQKAGFGYKDVPYKTDERSLEYDLNAAQAAGASPGRNPADVIPWALAYKGNLHIEVRLKSQIFDGTKWSRVVTGAAADDLTDPAAADRVYWSDTTKDPIPGLRQEVDIFLKRTGMLPTKLRMGREAFTTLSNHPLVRAQVSVNASGGGSATASFTPPATEMQLSALIGVPVSVGSAIQNLAGRGLDPNNDFIIPARSALLTFDAPQRIVTENTPTGFARVAFNKLAPEGFQVRRFPRPEIGAGGSEAHVLDLYFGFVIIDNKMGTYFDEMVEIPT